jgi:hypothetical protein
MPQRADGAPFATAWVGPALRVESRRTGAPDLSVNPGHNNCAGCGACTVGSSVVVFMRTCAPPPPIAVLRPRPSHGRSIGAEDLEQRIQFKQQSTPALSSDCRQPPKYSLALLPESPQEVQQHLFPLESAVSSQGLPHVES